MGYLLIAGIFLFLAGVAGFLSAPYVPTKRRDIERLLRLSEIKKGDIFYDLGCGDARVLRAAKKQGGRAVGYELSLLNFIFCVLRGFRVKFKNFFKGDFKDADIVYMFLSQKAHNAMGKILARQMKKGGKIIAYVWPIEGLNPERIDRMPGRPNLYLYRI